MTYKEQYEKLFNNMIATQNAILPNWMESLKNPQLVNVAINMKGDYKYVQWEKAVLDFQTLVFEMDMYQKKPDDKWGN